MRRLAIIAVCVAIAHELAAAYLAAHPLTTLMGGSMGRALLGVVAYVALVVARVVLLGALPARAVGWAVMRARGRNQRAG